MLSASRPVPLAVRHLSLVALLLLGQFALLVHGYEHAVESPESCELCLLGQGLDSALTDVSSHPPPPLPSRAYGVFSVHATPSNPVGLYLARAPPAFPAVPLI